jgi:hypothetical protein
VFEAGVGKSYYLRLENCRGVEAQIEQKVHWRNAGMKRIPIGGVLLLVHGLPVFVLCLASVVVLSRAQAMAQEVQPKDLPILQTWAGDYPVSELPRLPEGQLSSAVGYIGDAKTFGAVWHAFKPGENVPQVDFSTQLVVFYRNVVFYNRMSIFKITLRDGVAEVLAAETMSARPIEGRVGMAPAVIPREGVKFIQSGKERIPFDPKVSAADRFNATYTIEN